MFRHPVRGILIAGDGGSNMDETGMAPRSVAGAGARFIRAPFTVMGRLMLWLSTANLEILDRFPADRPKYVGLGSSVFITSAMAAVSGGFALHMALDLPIVACVVAGLLWGTAIMSFDRWLLATAGRGNLWLLLPRAALAFLIGLVVSTPFVLRIFQPEIMQQVALIQASAATSQQQDWNDPNNPIVRRINQLSADVGAQQKIIQNDGSSISAEDDATVLRLSAALSPDRDPMKTYNALNGRANCEAAGRTDCGGGVGSGRPGEGDRTRSLRQQADDYKRANVDPLQRQLDTARTTAVANLPARRAKAVQDASDRLDEDRRQLNPLLDQRRRLQSSFDSSNGRNTGLLIRMQALGDLTKHNATMRTTHHTLLAFITAIDCLPILFKLLMSFGRRSKYEEGLEAEEREHLAISRQRSRRLRAEQMIYQVDTLREAQAARDIRDEAMEGLARRSVRDQVEVAERRLDRWKREQLRRVDTDVNYLRQDQVLAPGLLPPHQRAAAANGADQNGSGTGTAQRTWPPQGPVPDEPRWGRRRGRRDDEGTPPPRPPARGSGTTGRPGAGGHGDAPGPAADGQPSAPGHPGAPHPGGRDRPADRSGERNGSSPPYPRRSGYGDPQGAPDPQVEEGTDLW
ncbi:conserved membrane hypothetical protein [Frankia canadensis]|uniref:DUF4407 domain-containing protein n=2 Tax=Frankia canadensis TaxID=1836972 RepID=A0A2I2L1P8_9ACTN|nr:conserved membrane hypothetical protein [Frankia canadensis]SOU59132.1 conserved membrane hypothetical protein [Frankia canadensis]